MTQDQTIAKARRILKSSPGTTLYVVFDDNRYHVATLFDLDTVYQGIPQQGIVWCSDDDE